MNGGTGSKRTRPPHMPIRESEARRHAGGPGTPPWRNQIAHVWGLVCPRENGAIEETFAIVVGIIGESVETDGHY